MATHTTPELRRTGEWFEASNKLAIVCKRVLYRIWTLPKNTRSVWLIFSDGAIMEGVPIRFQYCAYTTTKGAKPRAPLTFGLANWLQDRWPELGDGNLHKLYVRLEYAE